jgi:hypothetical protein
MHSVSAASSPCSRCDCHTTFAEHRPLPRHAFLACAASPAPQIKIQKIGKTDVLHSPSPARPERSAGYILVQSGTSGALGSCTDPMCLSVVHYGILSVWLMCST